MCIDKILIELNIISNISVGDKLMRYTDGTFAIDNRYFKGLRRIYSGDNRSTGLNDIENTINKTSEKVNDLLGLEILRAKNLSSQKDIEHYDEVVTNLKMLKKGISGAIGGINNLIETYSQDSYIMGRLSIMKERMEQKTARIEKVFEEFSY